MTRETEEQAFALNRQLFLTEQGYRYYVEDWAAPEGAGPGPEVSQGEASAEAEVISIAEVRARRAEAEPS